MTKRWLTGLWALTAMLFAGAVMAQEVSFKDPTGDDNGPGGYIYPTDGVYKTGSFDLTGLRVSAQGGKVTFELSVNSALEDPWGMGGGFAVQMAFIFIKTDPNQPGKWTQGLPGLNVQFAPGHGWDKCVILSPQKFARVKSEADTKAPAMRDDILIPTTTKGSGRTISGAVDLQALGGGDPASWGYQVLMQSNEGFPDAADLLTRKVNEYEGQHRFGGGTDTDADPHAIDTLAGNGVGDAAEVDAQHQMLQYEVGPDGIPTKTATLNMVYAPGHEPAAAAAAPAVPAAPAAPAAPVAAPPAPRPAPAAPQQKLIIGGTTYTKWLWGNQRDQGSLYNFTTVPGEGWGDNGQGSEVELLINAKLSKQVEVKGRLHSRFSQNFWTNFGGWGGRSDIQNPCTSGDCGEFDPRSNQYVKLRGVAVTLTPGYSWINSATIGASDWGMFDPFVIGRIRYIDRDNASGLLFQGSGLNRRWTWDAARISLPKLWAGPNWSTGTYHASDAAYGLQTKYVASDKIDVGGIFEFVNDQEVNAKDYNWDDGRDLAMRCRNWVVGGKVGVHPGPKTDVRGLIYHSDVKSDPKYLPWEHFGINGYSPVPLGKHQDEAFRINFDLNDPFDAGFSLNVEGFSIGAGYTSIMASRRENDVLLTEGHDSTWAFPGPSNAKYGIWGGNPTVIGYGGWDGNAQQVATLNVDNEFTDFDEPMAETCIGWQGLTFVPSLSKAGFDLAGEYTYLTYDTNWQAWGDDTRALDNTDWPAAELDTGVGHNFRSAYAPFQDKKTQIALGKFKYLANVGKGVDLFGKVKFISEQDNRMDDTRYLPYKPDGSVNYYYGNNTSSAVWPAPPIITVNGVTGYQWKPFNSINDDDRDLSYMMLLVGAGYQLSNDLYSSIQYEYYNADLKDGNTAFMAYKLMEMASGKHHKNRLEIKAKYNLAGAELGFEYMYAFGTFEPDFGDGFVVQYASEETAKNVHVPVGSPGFMNPWGGWNSLMTRDFKQQRIKAFMKVQF